MNSLYQWSTAMQLASVLMIAGLFSALARGTRRDALRWWSRAWLANAGALVVTVLFWFLAPSTAAAPVVRFAYLAFKTAFVVLLVHGAMGMRRPGVRWLPTRALVAIPLLVGLASAFTLTTIPRIGTATTAIIAGFFFYAGAATLSGDAPRGLRWLGWGFITRGTFALVEMVAYALQLLPPGSLTPAQLELVGGFLGAHSSFDVGAEWLLAIGGVLAVARFTQDELETTNADLLAAQEELRRIADRDPLTGLANRRTLAATFRAVHDTGATLLFLDLDDFKQVNDSLGHAAGDAMLRRFADTLRDCFRPDDTVARWAGDEFVVVCAGLTAEQAMQRVDRVRALVGEARIRFSVGIATLAPGGDAEEALRRADEDMYRAKGGATRG